MISFLSVTSYFFSIPMKYSPVLTFTKGIKVINDCSNFLIGNFFSTSNSRDMSSNESKQTVMSVDSSSNVSLN